MAVAAGQQLIANSAITANQAVRYESAGGNSRVEPLTDADTSLEQFNFAGVALEAINSGDRGVIIINGVVDCITRILMMLPTRPAASAVSSRRPRSSMAP